MVAELTNGRVVLSTKIHNDTPIEHRCANGTLFRAERADLRCTVEVVVGRVNAELVASDCAQFGAWHAMEMNGFQGYDSIRYRTVGRG